VQETGENCGFYTAAGPIGDGGCAQIVFVSTGQSGHFHGLCTTFPQPFEEKTEHIPVSRAC